MAAKQCKTAATADSTYCTVGIFSLPGLLLNTLNVLFRSWFWCGSSLPSLVLCTESSICTVQCTGAGSSAVPPSPPWSSTESSKYSVQVLVPVRLLPPLPGPLYRILYMFCSGAGSSAVPPFPLWSSTESCRRLSWPSGTSSSGRQHKTSSCKIGIQLQLPGAHIFLARAKSRHPNFRVNYQRKNITICIHNNIHLVCF